MTVNPSSLFIKHYATVTEVRRALKRIQNTIDANISVLQKHRSLLKTIALTLQQAAESKFKHRIAAKSADMVDYNAYLAAINVLNGDYKLLKHLKYLTANEFPQNEYLIHKLHREIDNFQKTIDDNIEQTNIIPQKLYPKPLVQSLKAVTSALEASYKFDVLVSTVMLTVFNSCWYYTVYIKISDLVDANGYVHPLLIVCVNFDPAASTFKLDLCHEMRAFDCYTAPSVSKEELVAAVVARLAAINILAVSAPTLYI